MIFWPIFSHLDWHLWHYWQIITIWVITLSFALCLSCPRGKGDPFSSVPIRLLLITIPQYAALSALKMMPYLRHVKGFSYFSVRCDIGELYCSGNSERNLLILLLCFQIQQSFALQITQTSCQIEKPMQNYGRASYCSFPRFIEG